MLENKLVRGTGRKEEDEMQQQEQGQAYGDGPKTGEGGTKNEAQKIADAMLAKKLKGMPSKEEVAEWQQWKEGQQMDAGADPQQKATEEATLQIMKLQQEAEAKLAGIDAGIGLEHLDDAVILAMARTAQGVPVQQAMLDVAERNPYWKTSVANLPNLGGNPAETKEPARKQPPVII